VTLERWDRIKAIGMIVTLLSAGVLQACNASPPQQKPEAQIQSELKASAEKNRHRRQRMIEEASIVCRDGSAYLVGDTAHTWRDGGPFATPYLRDGEPVTCGVGNAPGERKITR
jgi:hypothetical protein